MKKSLKKAGEFKKRGRKVTNVELDQELRQWILENRLKGKKVTAKRVLMKGRISAKEKSISGLKFTWGWFQKFLRRHHFSLRKPSTNNTKPMNLILPKAQSFIEEIKKLIEEGKYEMDFILNFDETGVVTEHSKTKTIEETGAKRVRVKTCGKSKDTHTVVLGGSMIGEKLPAMVILKGTGKKSLGIIIPKHLVIHHRKEGSWMDEKGMENYIEKILKPWASKIPVEKRALLLIDNSSTHINKKLEQKLKDLRIDVKTFPPCTTGYVQPMDIGVNAIFKNKISEYWDEYQFNQEETELTKKAKNFIAPSRDQKISWIGKAWNEVSEDNIKKSFSIYFSQPNPIVEEMEIEGQDKEDNNDEFDQSDASVEDEGLLDEKKALGELMNYEILPDNEEALLIELNQKLTIGDKDS